MTRSIWKGPFIDNYLFRKLGGSNKSGEALLAPLVSQLRSEASQTLPSGSAQLKIWSRRSTVIPQFIGQKVLIYNGKNWLNVLITEEMVGHKFGEFASTRKTTSKIQQRRNIKSKKIH
jgi:small subunit ribosomal protein S19